ncbi:MAG TPA: MBL fold metallo-hydrolase [Armatimonadota bacterium]|nr:MBL fold metallo-hydrolase [Armatimonadota bacterium]
MENLQQPLRPADGDSITWFGHACFRITDADGHTVLLDPYVEKVFGQSLQGLSADVVVVTHEHSDHNNTDAIQTPRVIHALNLIHDGEVKRVGDAPTGIVFTIIPTYHDEAHGHKRGLNAVVVWQEGGVTFCHLGDLGHELTPTQVELIGRPDVLMLPVGGYFTIDGDEARQVVKQLKPHLVIPMHYKVPGMTEQDLPITTEEPFLHVDGSAPWKEVKKLDSPILMVDANHIPASVEVDVLRPASL